MWSLAVTESEVNEDTPRSGVSGVTVREPSGWGCGVTRCGGGAVGAVGAVAQPEATKRVVAEGGEHGTDRPEGVRVPCEAFGGRFEGGACTKRAKKKRVTHEVSYPLVPVIITVFLSKHPSDEECF